MTLIQNEMLHASTHGDVLCFGVAFSRQQVLLLLSIMRLRTFFCNAYSVSARSDSSQEQKVYVQHIISQHAHHLAAAISCGACIIVCGAAQQMPKAVFAAIAEAIATGSNMSVEDAEKVLQGTNIACCHSL
jgi:sulfite reductase alpha subunit-like flavoprotein